MTARSQPKPDRVTTGVHRLRTGRWPMPSNVYLVESGPHWTLIDAGWSDQAPGIRSAAESLFGPATRPSAVVLTHIHPDHSGSAVDLCREWVLPVYVHPAEVPQAAGGILPGYANPLDRFLIAPLLRLLPSRFAASRDPLADLVQPFDPDDAVPGLPDWRCVPAPGHTPGSVAFWRPSDRVLITGDAVCTVDLNSVRGLLLGWATLGGPPWSSTWDWARARESVARLAELEPAVIAGGHGRPMTGAAPALHALASRMHRRR